MNFLLASVVLTVLIAATLMADRLHAKRQQRALNNDGTVPGQVTGMDGGGLSRAVHAEAKLTMASLQDLRSPRS